LIKIEKLEEAACKKLKNVDGVGFLADIYEEHGNTLAYMSKVMEFEKYYLKSMKLR
jgi:hypothetical protein